LASLAEQAEPQANGFPWILLDLYLQNTGDMTTQPLLFLFFIRMLGTFFAEVSFSLEECDTLPEPLKRIRLENDSALTLS